MTVYRFNNAGAWRFLNRYPNYLTTSDQFISDALYLAVGTQSSPYIQAYAFNSVTGYGTRYSNPSSSLSFYGQDVEFNNSRDVLFAADYSSPRVAAYQWSPSGFGTKYSNPSTLPTGTGNGVSVNDSDNAVVVAHSSSPYISGYTFSYAGGFGTKYSAPASIPAGTGRTIKLTDNYVFIGHDTTPYISAYPFNISTGFGTKYSNPSTLSSYGAGGLDYNSNNNTVAYGGIGFTFAYQWSSSGFGTKYAAPVGIGDGYGVEFNKKGDLLLIADGNSPYIKVFPWSSGFGTKYSDPATIPPAAAAFDNSGAITKRGDAVAIINSTSPYIHGYPFNKTTGFGTKYANPATAFTIAQKGVDLA